jgi:E3 ubiquitin-protein ligase RNF31
MHFTCSQCKFEFCIGCRRAFKLGTKCGRDAGCAKMGLHAHHPRNCLFYLRDKEPADLQKLLKKNKVEYLTAAPAAAEAPGCRVQVQKESPEGMVDGVCGEESPAGQAGYCTLHYVEYLCGLIIQNKLEVVTLMELGEVGFLKNGKVSLEFRAFD